MIQPKFALIPSGYKNGVYPATDGKVYTILPNSTISNTDYTDFERNGFGYRVKPDGLLEQTSGNNPRIDHTTECPALLLESASTNNFTYSETFSDSSWTKVSGTLVSSDETIAPDGNLTADKMYSQSSSQSSEITRAASTLANNWASFSVFIKNVDNEQDRIYMETGAQSLGYSVYGRLEFRFSDESFSIIAGDFVKYHNVTKYANGWYRLELTMKNPGYINGTYLWKLKALTGYGKGLYIWGAQHENNACLRPTSYMPTIFSTTTRNDEIISGANVQPYWNNPEGVMYLDIEPNINPSNTAIQQEVSIGRASAGTASFIRMTFRIDASDDTYINFSAFYPFTTALNYNHTIEFNQRIKCAIVYKTGIPGTYKVFVNGSLITTVFSGTFPTFTSAEMLLCTPGTTKNNTIFGRVYDYRYYDKELTDNEMIELTTV